VSQQTAHGVRALRNATARLDEVDGLGEMLNREFWKTVAESRVLEGFVRDAVARALPPSGDPEAAETAVAIEQQHRPIRSDSDALGDGDAPAIAPRNGRGRPP
jgi:hypothetical protein